MKLYALMLALMLPGGLLAAPENPKPAVPAKPTEQSVPVEEIRHFAQVFQAVRDSYVDALSNEQIMRAVRGDDTEST